MNVRASLMAAVSDFSGVFLCMHENVSDESCALHFGTKVRKMHSSRRDAFRSINTRPAARIFPSLGKVEKLAPSHPRAPNNGLSLDTKMNPNVALVYVYPGISPKAISALSSYDGVVLMGTGLGHLPVNTNNDPHGGSILSEVQQTLKRA